MFATEHLPSKKTLQKIIIVVLLVAACVITLLARREPSGTEARRTILKCTECGHSEAITLSELKKKTKDQDKRWLSQLEQTDPQEAKVVREWLENPGVGTAPSRRPVWGEAAWPLLCVECGEDAAIFAFKCTECGAIFFRLDTEGRLRDACPECAFPTRNMVPRPPQPSEK